jgi:hypothetical protein
MSNTEDFELWREELVTDLIKSLPQEEAVWAVALAIVSRQMCQALQWPEKEAIELSMLYVKAAQLTLAGDKREGQELLERELRNLYLKYRN